MVRSRKCRNTSPVMVGTAKDRKSNPSPVQNGPRPVPTPPTPPARRRRGSRHGCRTCGRCSEPPADRRQSVRPATAHDPRRLRAARHASHAAGPGARTRTGAPPDSSNRPAWERATRHPYRGCAGSSSRFGQRRPTTRGRLDDGEQWSGRTGEPDIRGGRGRPGGGGTCAVPRMNLHQPSISPVGHAGTAGDRGLGTLPEGTPFPSWLKPRGSNRPRPPASRYDRPPHVQPALRAGQDRGPRSGQGSWAHPMVAAMRDHDRPRADLRALLERVEAASPTDAIEVAADLARGDGRSTRGELSDRGLQWPGPGPLRHIRARGSRRAGAGTEQADTVPLAGTIYEHVLRTQQIDVHELADGAHLTVPVTDRGDAIGVIELILPRVPTTRRSPRSPRPRTHSPTWSSPTAATPTCSNGANAPPPSRWPPRSNDGYSRPPTPARPASSPSPAGWNRPAPSAATPSTTPSTAKRCTFRSPTPSGTRSRRHCWPHSWSAACATAAAAE